VLEIAPATALEAAELRGVKLPTSIERGARLCL
jgi:hypothetical protein